MFLNIRIVLSWMRCEVQKTAFRSMQKDRQKAWPPIWRFPSGTAIAGWFIRENPTRIDDLGYPHFRKPLYCAREKSRLDINWVVTLHGKWWVEQENSRFLGRIVMIDPMPPTKKCHLRGWLKYVEIPAIHVKSFGWLWSAIPYHPAAVPSRLPESLKLFACITARGFSQAAERTKNDGNVW